MVYHWLCSTGCLQMSACGLPVGSLPAAVVEMMMMLVVVVCLNAISVPCSLVATPPLGFLVLLAPNKTFGYVGPSC